MKLLIGITGGIGSGKSSVTADLRKRGETVICADETSRQVVEPGQPGAEALRKIYGDRYFLPDGTLNRRMLASHVFSNPDRLTGLNNLLHPYIVSRMLEQAALQQGRTFLDASLLIQTGIYHNVDYVWLVVADMETRIHRVMIRDLLSREEVLKRISNQMPDSEMMLHAHEVIDNNGTLDQLHQVISKLLIKPDYSR
jgi:dephospho-CoA kinase